MHKIILYFPLDALHVSDYISPSSGATFISCTSHLVYAGTIWYRHIHKDIQAFRDQKNGKVCLRLDKSAHILFICLLSQRRWRILYFMSITVYFFFCVFTVHVNDAVGTYKQKTATQMSINLTLCPGRNFVFIFGLYNPLNPLWLLFVPSGLTFKNSTFCKHSVFMCFVCIYTALTDWFF